MKEHRIVNMNPPIGSTSNFVIKQPMTNQTPDSWEGEFEEMSQRCLVPDVVDDIPEDAWVNGWFKAMEKAKNLTRTQIHQAKAKERERVDRVWARKVIPFLLTQSRKEIIEEIEKNVVEYDGQWHKRGKDGNCEKFTMADLKILLSQARHQEIERMANIIREYLETLDWTDWPEGGYKPKEDFIYQLIQKLSKK